MMFEMMLKVVKGFKKLNNNPVTEQSQVYLNKLIKLSKRNGLVEVKEENGEKVLYFGAHNIEMVRINEKENKKNVRLHKINADKLASEVVRQGILAGL